MMQLSLPLVLCQCAIFLALLEGIVCPVLMNFVVKQFNTADIYSRVSGEGDNITGRFILRKSVHDPNERGYSFRRRQRAYGRHIVVQIRDIVLNTLRQEGNDPSIITFSVRRDSANYNIRFKDEDQANRFMTATDASLKDFTIRWGRRYIHSRPVIIAYEKFNSGDIGFKLLDNEDYTNEYARLAELPYVFKLSEMRNHIRRTTSNPAHTLYLRNSKEMEDYEIMFQSEENLDKFLEFFPNKAYNDYKTQGYYMVPAPRHYDDASTSRAQDTSESQDTSD